ncbi:hypothetical protein [Alloprevotella tannerae]|nr:hypothetical protein [Alloprevotella tannerae]
MLNFDLRIRKWGFRLRIYDSADDNIGKGATKAGRKKSAKGM